MNAQLVSANGYNTNNMVFSKPISGNIKDTSINFRRINISTKYSDGTIGDLIIPTERLFSFGVCENLDAATKKVNGYVFPLCLYGKDGASENEKMFVQTFNSIVEKCKKHLLDNKKELKLHDLEPSDLKKFNPLYYSKVDGVIVEDKGPTLYAKLIVSKKNGQEKIISDFFDTNGNQLNALDILKKYCHANAAIKIESIFLGNKISLQVKLYEAQVELSEMGMRRLLPRSRPQANSNVSITNNSKSVEVDDDTVDDDNEGNDDAVVDDVGSIKSDIDDEELEEPEPPKVLPKKKIVKVVSKKKKGDE
jgi:hypothetical protein